MPGAPPRPAALSRALQAPCRCCSPPRTAGPSATPATATARDRAALLALLDARDRDETAHPRVTVHRTEEDNAVHHWPITPVPYTIEVMDGGRYTIEVEPEVSLWLENIPARHYVVAEQKVDRLAENATTLGEPYTRHLGGKLRELRFDLDGNAQRVTYWIAPGRRIVLLTVFRKTRMRETAEVERARAAQAVCEARHEPAAEHAVYSRNLKEELR